MNQANSLAEYELFIFPYADSQQKVERKFNQI